MHAAGSLLAGGGIQVLNLKALERSVRRVLGRSGEPGATGVVLVIARTTLLLAVVLWVLAAVKVHLPGFAIGLFLAVPASIWHGLSAREVG
jgi:hypothetical protein